MDRSKIKTADEAVPYSIDAERSVLGSMIISKNAVEVAMELLKTCLLYTSPSPRD